MEENGLILPVIRNPEDWKVVVRRQDGHYLTDINPGANSYGWTRRLGYVTKFDNVTQAYEALGTTLTERDEIKLIDININFNPSMKAAA